MYPKCPVCGFFDMPYAPVPFNVCPCCGTEFGVDDRKVTHRDLRHAWISSGMPWFDDISSPPKNWNRYGQLSSLQDNVELVSDTAFEKGDGALIGTMVPPDKARLLDSQVRVFGNTSDLASYLRMLPA